MKQAKVFVSVVIAGALLAAISILSSCHKELLIREILPPQPFGTIHRYDSRFDQLVPLGVAVEKLATGFERAEGPVWVPDEDYLLVSDITRNTIFCWKRKKGVMPYLKPSGYTGTAARRGESGSNGLVLDPLGRLVICEHGDRRITRLEDDNTKTVICDQYEGNRLNSPNDAVFKSNGDLYFTDPPYGLAKLNTDPAKELGFNGVYRVSRNGEVTVLIKDLSFPNGIAFSPDEKTLYVSNSDPKKAVWMAYDVKDDGTVGAGRVFFDATDWVKGRQGLPDGLKVDESGNLFATGPGGLHVFAPDGTLLGTIDTGEKTANCAFGEDGSTLFLASHMFLASIRLNTRGLGF